MTHSAVLVGAGAMSRKWLAALSKIGGVEIVGIVDIDLANAQRRAQESGILAETGTELASMLARHKPDIVLDIAVPSARHAIVAQALNAGCHVLSEKPMAETLEQAADLVAKAKRAGRLHVVVQNRRFHRGLRAVKASIDAGVIGTVTGIHCDFFLDPHFGGFRETMPHVLLLDMAVHTFDAARFVLGQRPKSVYAEEWRPLNSWNQEGDSAWAAFVFEQGTRFTYRGSWCAPGMRTSWEGAWRITGTLGSMLWDGADAITAERAGPAQPGQLLPDNERIPIPVDIEKDVNGHEAVMTQFLAAIDGGPTPETIGHDNINSLAMALGAIDSVRLGRRVEIDF